MGIRTRTFSVTGVGTTETIDIIDSNQIAISYQINVTGSITYTIEHSLDGINFIENTDNQNKTTNSDGNYVLPVRAVRLRTTAGTGTATLIVRQLVV